MRYGQTVSTIACLTLCIADRAMTQKAPATTSTVTTYHPRITSLSTTTPTPGQTVTINGSDLLPPTWTATLQYKRKYGGQFIQLPLTGTNSALTFRADTNMKPDSIAIQYTNDSTIARLENPIPSLEQRPSVPILFVQERPKIDASSLTSVSGQAGAFLVLATGSTTIRGRNFLKAPTISITQSGGTTGGVISQPTFSTTVTVDQGPTVSAAGTGLSVTNPRYVPTSRDEATISIPTSFVHNTTGFLKFSTPAGADSTRVTIVQPPQDARLFESGAGAPVTSGVLFIGKNYVIRGHHLAPIQRLTQSGGNIGAPTVAVGGSPISLFPGLPPGTIGVLGLEVDTIVQFTMPNFNAVTGSVPVTISHAGGTLSLGSFLVRAQPAALQISGAVISPNEIIGGTRGTITLSLNPTPNFTNAGELTIAVSSSLSGAIPPISPVLITANPMTISIPTNVIQTTASGNITVSHNTPGGGNATIPVTVRPPRPTAVVVSPDSVPGSTAAPASVTFDLPGTATVLLSSSDPSIATVPASVARSGGNAASFSINTVQVTAPHSITISASLNGVSVSKTIVVRPGRVSSIVANPSTVIAGEQIPVTLTFDAPVSGLTVSLTATDTAIRSRSATANGTSLQTSLNTTTTLLSNVVGNINAAGGGVTKSTDVQVRPIQITQFTLAPTSGTAGSTIAATVTLGHAVFQSQVLQLASSDTTVATVPSSVSFSTGEDVKVVTVTLRRPQTATKTATITATLRATTSPIANNVTSTKTATVTVTP